MSAILDYLRSIELISAGVGGGIRGLGSAVFWKSLEDFLGMPILKAFAECKQVLMTGSSTGALQAGGLQAGLTPAQMIDVYYNRTPEILNHGTAVADAEMIRRGYKFESQNTYNVLKSILGPAVNWKINDCPFPILLTADGAGRRPWYFTQDRKGVTQDGKAFNSCYTGEANLIDCMVASSAAPTVFSQWYVPPCNGHLVGWCKDGGVGVAANPVHRAAIEAFHYGTFDRADTVILLFGTGHYDGVDPNPPSGIVPTIEDAIDSILAVANHEQTKLVQMYYPEVPLSILDFTLPNSIDEADLSARDSLLTISQKAADQTDWAVKLGLTKS